jgi:menaquinone-dependent protoporphyrinogen IX oxidase
VEGLKVKGVVVFDTSYGNTKKIAETITETLKESGVEVDIFYVKDTKKLSAKEYDFLVVGSPTRFDTMSFAIKGFLGKVKSEEWVNKPFMAFDTENPENVEKKEYSAAEKIARALKEDEATVASSENSCLGKRDRLKKAKSSGRKSMLGQSLLN